MQVSTVVPACRPTFSNRKNNNRTNDLQRAIEAANWGMPAVNFDLMAQTTKKVLRPRGVFKMSYAARPATFLKFDVRHGSKPWSLAVIVRRHTLLTKDEQLKSLKMGRIIAAINMTLDGICDHTAGTPDEELLQHYADLLSNVDTVLYGRITYQLMKYWKAVAEKPTGEKATDEFAVIMNKISKIVFSHTLKNVDWESARLANRDLEDEVLELKQQSGKDILVGSRSLIIQLMKLNLIDEFQLCVHPVVAGSGLPLFENITDRTVFKLTKTKTFSGGAVTLYYEPTKKTTSR